MPLASVSRRFQGSAFAAVLGVLVALVAPPVGCSSGGDGPPRCISSRCPPGDECIDDGAGAACRQVCTSSSECAFNMSCNDGLPRSWCVTNSYVVPQLPTGQWGATCAPTRGEANNPDCDGDDGFACYGTSPTDANAFCTFFGCAADTDCPGSWWCATVNQAPNVKTNKPSYGSTLHVCLPRAYCAPCKLDHDCPAATGGTQQHCATDAQGSGYCTTECESNANCALDAMCKNWQSLCTPAQGASCHSDEDCPPGADGVAQHCDGARCTPECGGDGDCLAALVVVAPRTGLDAQASGAPAVDGKCQWRGLCNPRAGVCRGSGGFCSPCRSDADCVNGYCISAMPYSTERFCSSKSTRLPCDTMSANPAGCPAHGTSDPWALNGCVSAPANQCEGFVVLGSATGQPQELPGCWTANR